MAPNMLPQSLMGEILATTSASKSTHSELLLLLTNANDSAMKLVLKHNTLCPIVDSFSKTLRAVKADNQSSMANWEAMEPVERMERMDEVVKMDKQYRCLFHLTEQLVANSKSSEASSTQWLALYDESISRIEEDVKASARFFNDTKSYFECHKAWQLALGTTETMESLLRHEEPAEAQAVASLTPAIKALVSARREELAALRLSVTQKLMDLGALAQPLAYEWARAEVLLPATEWEEAKESFEKSTKQDE
ncbi:uncharacterized protein BKA78DRAFT_25970 [Phyllosticta capitalensis]|uniref:uncharacterized protein n=1 Tax=Phyllosticta capitalensis TaxID=121624 RepID=UPI00312FA6AB